MFAMIGFSDNSISTMLRLPCSRPQLPLATQFANMQGIELIVNCISLNNNPLLSERWVLRHATQPCIP